MYGVPLYGDTHAHSHYTPHFIHTMLKGGRFEFWLLVHGALGVGASLAPSSLAYLVFAVMGYAIWQVFKTRNLGGIAHIASAYLVSIEVLLRMAGSGLPHEGIKYFVSVILVLGYLLYLGKRGLSWAFVLFMVLLLPSIVLVETESFEMSRQYVSANLSGPFALAVAAIYFYKLSLSKENLGATFQAILLPMAAILGFLFIKTPDFDEIEFGNMANYATSGGFGPNQVSSALGLGLMVIVLGYFLKISLFNNNMVQMGMIALLLFRGLLTFSRGGLLGPTLSILAVALISFFFNAEFRALVMRRIYAVGFGLLLLAGAWKYTDNLTGGELARRFDPQSRADEYTGQVDYFKYTSGRTMIAEIDLRIFADYPLAGIGPGMGFYRRVDYGYDVEVAAHIEQTRLLAEHGVLGLIVLLIMLIFPIVYYYELPYRNSQLILVACFLFAFLYMTHAATRLCMPSFIYGLGLIRYRW